MFAAMRRASSFGEQLGGGAAMQTLGKKEARPEGD